MLLSRPILRLRRRVWLTLAALSLSQAGIAVEPIESEGVFVSAGGNATGGVFKLQDSLGGGVSFGEQSSASFQADDGWLASLNNAPVARNLSLGRGVESNVKIPIAKLLAVASDVDGNPVSLATFDSHSANGHTVIRDGAWLIVFNAGSAAADSLAYTLTDGVLRSAPATVSISLNPADNSQSQNILSTVLEGGAIVIRFGGIPGLSYRVQYTTGLSTPNWITLGNVTAGANGLFLFRDEGIAEGARFYRTVYP